jgi:threonine/homoserine/homoserine lactone efflux protein
LKHSWLVFSAISIFTGTVGEKIIQNPGIDRYIKWGKAGIFTFIGIKLALSHK